ncbi:MAG: serine/threonine protein kinase [Myxococcales bacterium]|nr:serine/threonine protein kinase [Myxococcales bacterium]
MAELFLAQQSGIVAGFEKTLVIKRLLPIFSTQEDVIRMFLNEARLAALLSHPNIVQIYDLGQQDEHYYIAMEYVEGRDLNWAQRVHYRLRRRVSCEIASYIVSCLCRGLHYAHESRDRSGNKVGLIHRDVSPHNVLLSFNGDVKLADFGIAKSTAMAAETQAGVLKGKLSYMSPEQMSGDALDSRSDVFSTGIVLYELLAARKLFRRKSDFDTIKAVREAPITPISVIRDDVPPRLERVINTALERDRQQRYGSAEQMLLDIEEVVDLYGWHYGPRNISEWLAELAATDVGKALSDRRDTRLSSSDLGSGSDGSDAEAPVPAMDDSGPTNAIEGDDAATIIDPTPYGAEPAHPPEAITIATAPPALAPAMPISSYSLASDPSSAGYSTPSLQPIAASPQPNRSRWLVLLVVLLWLAGAAGVIVLLSVYAV